MGGQAEHFKALIYLPVRGIPLAKLAVKGALSLNRQGADYSSTTRRRQIGHQGSGAPPVSFLSRVCLPHRYLHTEMFVCVCVCAGEETMTGV